MQTTLYIENQFVRVLRHIDFAFPHQINGCQSTILGVSPFKQLLRRSSTLSELSCMGMFEALEGRPGSIKGDVKRKHFFLRWEEDSSLTSSPLGSCRVAEIRSCLSVFMPTLRRRSVAEAAQA